MLNTLAGYRTYILAAGAVIAAIVSFLAGDSTLSEAINNGLMGAGLATLRAGVAGK
jgi:hypothetical protein